MQYPMFDEMGRTKVSIVPQGSKIPTEADGYLLFIPPAQKKDRNWDEALSFVETEVRGQIEAAAKRFAFEPKPNEVLTFDLGASRRIVVVVLPSGEPQPFFYLEVCRKAAKAMADFKVRKLWADFRGCPEGAAIAANSLVAATVALLFEAKQYSSEKVETKKSDSRKLASILYLMGPKGSSWKESDFLSSIQIGAATNIVRYLAGLPGNELTPSAYVSLVTQVAKKQGLRTEFYSLEKLKKMGAGAFLAVTQASEDRGAGILKLVYRPARFSSKIALVGKGITFDTGGAQIKTQGHMFGMNGDMGGSAVAFALVLLAAQQKWPWEVSSYLAIAENAIGPRSYKPNDIVRTLKGKTIEVVDSDAEGRMILSDTLALASDSSPDLLLDFATLTGACVRAIGTNYSGVYTNRSDWYQELIESGKQSGERVWPFPNDEDYGRCLKSEIADIKQCRLTGGSDHIEAGYFLRQFVPDKTPWVHVDLSAAETDEGLGHIPTKLTGFGVRFASEFIRRWASRR